MPAPPTAPFELRALVALPFPAWAIGVTIGALSFAACLALLALSGAPLTTGDPGTGLQVAGQTHLAFLTTAALGYLFAAGIHFTRLAPTPAAPARAGASGLLSGVAGVLVCLLLIRLTTAEIRLQEPGRDPWSAGELALDVVALALFWGIGRAIHFTILGTRRSSTAEAAIDLLNLPALYPLAHSGLRSALAWIAGISLVVAIMAFDPNPGILKESGRIITLAIAASVLTGSFSLFMPLWQLKKRIADEKARRMQRILRELRELPGTGTAQPGREADLYARYAHLAGIREWPVDVETLRRFGFYVFFPAISWMAGTVTQRLLDTVLLGDLVRFALSSLR